MDPHETAPAERAAAARRGDRLLAKLREGRQRIAQRAIPCGDKRGYLIAALSDRPPSAFSTQRNGYGINFVLRGEGHYRDDGSGEERRLSPGTLYHRLPNRRYRTRLDGPGFVEAYVYLNPLLWNALSPFGVLRTDQTLQPGIDPFLNGAFADLLTALEGSAPAGLVLARAITWIQECYARADERSQGDSWVRRIRRLCAEMESSPLDEPRIDEHAEAWGTSEVSVRRHFREIIGCSPGQFRAHCRLGMAAEMLRERSVSATARALGWADAFSFSRSFRRHFGVPPSSVRGAVTSPRAPPPRPIRPVPR